jgi:Cu/Ag efflux pump CusA
MFIKKARSCAFFTNMAASIMFGLALATMLTLIAAPAVYALLFRMRQPAAAQWRMEDCHDPPLEIRSLLD